MHSRHRKLLVWTIATLVAVAVLDAVFPLIVIAGVAMLVMSVVVRVHGR